MASITPASQNTPVSVVVLARNEEDLIGECLDSVVGWCSEVIVIDMASTDSTASISMARGALVLPHRLIGNFDFARSLGIQKAKNDWIFVLDADELPTAALLKEMTEAIQTASVDCVLIPRANFALSGFAPHESMFPEMTMRLFRRSMVDLEGYQGKIHTFYSPLPSAKTTSIAGVFPEKCLLHFSNPALEEFWGKINRYTSEEARSRNADAPTPIKPIQLLAPLRIFYRKWVKGKAWKDGWRGFWLSWISAVYEGLVLAKQWEMSLHDGKIPDAKMARSHMRAHVRALSVKSGNQ